jgi:hypothetical protein
LKVEWKTNFFSKVEMKGRKEGDEVEDPEVRLNMKRCQINKKERKKERKFQT